MKPRNARNAIVEIECAQLGKDKITVIHRMNPPKTVIRGHKPHIHRRNGTWVVHGLSWSQNDFYRLSSFIGGLNGDV